MTLSNVHVQCFIAFEAESELASVSIQASVNIFSLDAVSTNLFLINLSEQTESKKNNFIQDNIEIYMSDKETFFMCCTKIGDVTSHQDSHSK